MTEQCQLALHTILDALPPRGRMNAGDVQWLRSIALAGLGADPLGAELVTLETVQLRAVATAAAIQMAAMEIGLTPDWDNLLDALHTAGYDEQRCAELWWNRYGTEEQEQR